MNNLYYNDKKLKQIKSKRTQKRKRVWGWILTVLGALELPAAIAALDASALISPLIFLIPGIEPESRASPTLAGRFFTN